jgi:SAM-dependent methyltransferase
MGIIGRTIRWTLNALPRTLLQRVAGVAVPMLGLLYAGKGRHCPVCGAQLRRFLPYGYGIVREDALCPRCLALERHRLLWLWLSRETALFEERPVLLHIAPEVCLMRHIERTYADCAERYLTADLESPLAKLHFDVQQIPLTDESVDVVICNHLLEHVASDGDALRELHHIMRPGGWGVMLAPFATVFHSPRGVECPKWWQALDILPVHLLTFAIPLVLMNNQYGGSQVWATLALVPLLLYSGKRGKLRLKYLVYIYYPSHILLLHLLAMLFGVIEKL